MEINEAIIGRRAVREYTTEAVDEQAIRRLIDAAIQAPSAVNQQPWTFTVVRDQAVLDRISRDAKTHMLATMPASPHTDHFQSLLDDPSFHIFYHAPRADRDFGGHGRAVDCREDCALAAENLMLAAYAHRTRLLLDWLRAELHQHGGWEGHAWPSRCLGAGCAHHRWTRRGRAAARRAQQAGDSLDWLRAAASRAPDFIRAQVRSLWRPKSTSMRPSGVHTLE